MRFFWYSLTLPGSGVTQSSVILYGSGEQLAEVWKVVGGGGG